MYRENSELAYGVIIKAIVSDRRDILWMRLASSEHSNTNEDQKFDAHKTPNVRGQAGRAMRVQHATKRRARPCLHRACSAFSRFLPPSSEHYQHDENDHNRGNSDGGPGPIELNPPYQVRV